MCHGRSLPDAEGYARKYRLARLFVITEIHARAKSEKRWARIGGELARSCPSEALGKEDL